MRPASPSRCCTNTSTRSGICTWPFSRMSATSSSPRSPRQRAKQPTASHRPSEGSRPTSAGCTMIAVRSCCCSAAETVGTKTSPSTIRKVVDASAEAIAPLIAADIDSEHQRTIAHGLVGLAEGVSRRLVSDEIDFDPDVVAQQVADVAWAGLRGVRRVGESVSSLSRIWSAVLVQTKGFGLSFQVSIQARMSVLSSAHERCAPRRSFLSVSSANQRSTRLSQTS